MYIHISTYVYMVAVVVVPYDDGGANDDGAPRPSRASLLHPHHHHRSLHRWPTLHPQHRAITTGSTLITTTQHINYPYMNNRILQAYIFLSLSLSLFYLPLSHPLSRSLSLSLSIYIHAHVHIHIHIHFRLPCCVYVSIYVCIYIYIRVVVKVMPSSDGAANCDGVALVSPRCGSTLTTTKAITAGTTLIADYLYILWL